MTAVALLVLAAYFVVGPLCVAWCLRRIDAAFVRGMQHVLRSPTPGGSEAADQSTPQGRSAAAGVERGGPHAVCAPPATQALAGAADPRHVAPARLHRVRVTVHG